MKKILSVFIVLLCVLCLCHFADSNTEDALTESVAEQEQILPDSNESEFPNIPKQNNNLLLVGEITYPYQKPAKPSASFGIDESRSGRKIYSEAEISETPFAIFDEENRLVYALAHGTRSGASYPYDYEEDFYERNDIEHTCRHILYQSDVRSYDIADDSCHYVYDRDIQEIEYWQFSETGSLISYQYYSPKHIGVSTSSSAADGTTLYFNSGYLAEYDGEYLMSEFLLPYNQGRWSYHIYQYDDDGNCTMEIIPESTRITLYAYEYNEPAGQVTRYEYLMNGEWELPCKDGSSYSFYPGDFEKGIPAAVKKTAADGTVLTEFFQDKAYYIEQECLIAEEIEEAANTSRYIIVQPGDSLWSIAEQSYGNGIYSGILYQANHHIIGLDKDMLLPGMRLYIPEIWGSSGDILNLN